MDFVGEYVVPASRDEVWRALNDPDVLKHCIPGCEHLDKVSDTDFAGKLVMKVGAIKARLNGKVELSDINAPNSYTISGRGQGGVAGFAKGGARVSLQDAGSGATLLQYQAAAQLGGKLATVGSRVFEGIARKMADDFFGRLAAHFGGGVADDRALEMASARQDQAAVGSAVTGPEAGMSGTANPVTAPRGFDGTLRDLLWFGIGLAVGALVTWALVA